MKTASNKQTDKPPHFAEVFIEVLAWLRIALSPSIAGLIIGFLVYLALPEPAGIVLSSVVAATGVIVGIIWATRIWRNSGTTNFMARVNTVPELSERSDEDGDDKTDKSDS